MRLFRALLLLVMSALPLLAAASDLVVVVNPRSGADRLSREEVMYIFLGRHRALPSGIVASPADLSPDSQERVLFYRRLVNKEPAEIRAYWSRLVFSGGARPPIAVDSAEEMLKHVAATPGGIGYVERSRVDARVRVVFELPER